LNETVDLLEEAINKIPESVQGLMGMKGAILSRIQPFDPGQASRLLEEMAEIESGMKRGDVLAIAKIESFIVKLTTAIEEIEKKRPDSQLTCCEHKISSGQRYCPNCHEDTWMLGGRSSTKGSFSH
jgi:hypothetical protein